MAGVLASNALEFPKIAAIQIGRVPAATYTKKHDAVALLMPCAPVADSFPATIRSGTKHPPCPGRPGPQMSVPGAIPAFALTSVQLTPQTI